MASWRDSITFTVEIAFTTDPLATPTYTDVSAYVRSIPRIFHGSTSDLSPIGPSSATVVLSNRDRRFDPDYTSGPHYGSLVPMRKIKITAGLGAFSAVVFTGFVTGWPTQWTSVDGTCQIECIDGQQFLTEDLPGSAYAGEVIADSPVVYWPMQNAAATDAIKGPDGIIEESRGSGILTTADQTWPLGQSLGLLQQQVGAGGVIVGADSTLASAIAAIEMITTIGADSGSQTYARGGTTTTTWFALQIVPGTTGAVVQLGYSHASDNLRNSAAGLTQIDTSFSRYESHHVVALRNGSAIDVYVDGSILGTVALSAGTQTLSSVTTAGYQTQVKLGTVAGETEYPILGHVAMYTTAPSSTRVSAHAEAAKQGWVGEASGARVGRVLDNIGWPAGLRDIDTGQTQHGAYLPGGLPAIDYLRNVENVEQGLLFRDRAGNVHFKDRQWWWMSADTGYILSDDGAAGAVQYFELEPAGNHVDNLENIVTVSYSTVGGITRRDATSVADYGPSPKFIDGPTLADARTASTLAAYRLREHKDPKTRISALRAGLRSTTAALTTVQVEKLLDLELGDVVTVEYTPLQTGNQVVKKVVVWGIEHEITPEQWYVGLFLSPAPTSAADAPYLTLGHATRGKIGTVNGNKMPY